MTDSHSLTVRVSVVPFARGLLVQENKVSRLANAYAYSSWDKDETRRKLFPSTFYRYHSFTPAGWGGGIRDVQEVWTLTLDGVLRIMV